MKKVSLGGRTWLIVRRHHSRRLPWMRWYWAWPDGSPVLHEHAVWWRHVHGVALGTGSFSVVVYFRHNHGDVW